MTQLETKTYSNTELLTENVMLRGKLKNLAIQTQMLNNLIATIIKQGGNLDLLQSSYKDVCADLNNGATRLILDSNETNIKITLEKNE